MENLNDGHERIMAKLPQIKADLKEVFRKHNLSIEQFVEEQGEGNYCSVEYMLVIDGDTYFSENIGEILESLAELE